MAPSRRDHPKGDADSQCCKPGNDAPYRQNQLPSRAEAARDQPVIDHPCQKRLSYCDAQGRRATVVHLLENTMIRVGNSDYARQNRSRGLTTLRDRHVRFNGNEVRFRFTDKGGREWDLGIRDRRVARIMRAAQDLPGQHLFQYLDQDGAR